MERHFQLLTSNIAPDEMEVESIRECIDVRTKTIDRLDLEASRLDAERQRIELEWRRVTAERDRVAAEREALRRVSSPLRRLPDEILSEVFIRVVHDQHDRYRIPAHRRLTCLSMVAKLWRTVAKTTPRLWNHLTFRPFDPHCDDFVAKVSTWFGRAGDLPRYLEFQDLHRCQHVPSGDSCLLVTRWQVAKLMSKGLGLHSLSLQDVRSECLLELATHIEDERARGTGPWDPLESLWIWVVPYFSAETDGSSNLQRFLRSLPPTIRDLKLQGLNRCRDLVQLLSISNTSLQHVTTLSLGGLPLSTILEFAQLCSELSNLSIFPIFPSTSQNHKTYRLPTVRVLKMGYWAFSWTAILPQILRTPSLTELDIGIEDSDEDADGATVEVEGIRVHAVAGLAHFIQQSEVGVHRLRIRYLDREWQGFERIFSRIPTVVDLTLDCAQVDASIFRPSHPTPDQNSLFCPSLRAFRLCHAPPDFQFEDVCTFFARGRAESPAGFEALKTLVLVVDSQTFQNYDTPGNSFRTAIQQLRKLGVDVGVYL